MTNHAETRLLPYSADLMYRVVADVESYPRFLPGCSALRVLSRAKDGRNEILIAEMLIGYAHLRERYTSRAVLDPEARTIAVTQEKGPFKYLENNWRFTPQGAHCAVDFSIRFEFKSRILNAVAAHVFERMMLRMVDAFTERARTLSQNASA
jgi:coenzyme Q-binding protein COQ10